MNPDHRGTKAAAHYVLELEPGASTSLRLRLRRERLAGTPFGDALRPRSSPTRIAEADAFYAAGRRGALGPAALPSPARPTPACVWSKQFYYYAVRDWQLGDPGQPEPPAGRGAQRATGPTSSTGT